MSDNPEILAVLKEIRDLLKEHNAHLHCMSGHAKQSSKFSSPEHTLMQEFMTQRDLDGNHAVYGHEFLISNPPPMLAAIYQQAIVNNPKINIISPDEYQANLPS